MPKFYSDDEIDSIFACPADGKTRFDFEFRKINKLKAQAQAANQLLADAKDFMSDYLTRFRVDGKNDEICNRIIALAKEQEGSDASA